MSDYLDLNNEELLKDFFSEAEQQVEHLESNILVIENDPNNHDAIDEIFRAAHTLKGGSATVEMTELSTFTHVVEDLLDELRSGHIGVTEEVIDTLLSSIDIIKAMLGARAEGLVYQEDVEPIKNKLKSFIQAKAPTKAAVKKTPPVQLPTAAPPAPVAQAEQSGSAVLADSDLDELKQVCPPGNSIWELHVVFDEANPMNSVGGIQVFAALKEYGTVLKTVPDFDDLYEDVFHPEVVYYFASTHTAEKLEDVAFLNDVTLSTSARRVETDVKKTPAVSAVSAPVKPAAVQHEPAPEAVASDDSGQNAADAAVLAVNAQISDEKEKTDAATAKKSAPAAQHVSGGSVLRVDSKRIDYLLNLVSETVITKASFNQTAAQIGDLQSQFQALDSEYKEKLRQLFEHLPKYLEEIQGGASMKEIKTSLNKNYGGLFTEFAQFETALKTIAGKFRSSTQNLGRIAGELQEGVMKIRMVPISQIFSRFPRVVRDLSRSLDKKINLVIEGEDTELDKSVIEDLLDPIMHCVRNSLDHGIEQPQERLEAGKNDEGTLLLKASNEGNMIVIDIIDDGKGIDVEKVRAKAIERGIIHPTKILTDQEAFQLIFEPGFSTASKITSVSGRGVGLDVVKTQIEKLNGSVVVSSEHGTGTKFSIRLPLTLAIIQGLLVRVGTEVYSIPIVSVIESHRVKNQEVKTIDNYEVLNVRDEVISILRLNRLFGIKNADNADHSFAVIVGTADKKIGVMVDSLIGEEDVVIKPLRDQFTNSPGIAGASILGDGSVSLIIDVSQLLDLGVKQELQARQERDALVF